MLQDFYPSVPTVLGHATSKNDEVDDEEWWTTRQSLLSDSTKLLERERT